PGLSHPAACETIASVSVTDYSGNSSWWPIHRRHQVKHRRRVLEARLLRWLCNRTRRWRDHKPSQYEARDRSLHPIGLRAGTPALPKRFGETPAALRLYAIGEQQGM